MHWPDQQCGADDLWMENSLPKFKKGQPAATSVAVFLAGSAPITYQCALHPEETGTITFPPQS